MKSETPGDGARGPGTAGHRVVDLMAALEASLAAVKAERAHWNAMEDHPGCGPCRRGQGTVAPGPPHKPTTPGHAPHCGCDFCW